MPISKTIGISGRHTTSNIWIDYLCISAKPLSNKYQNIIHDLFVAYSIMKYISINLIIALSELYLKCFTIETYVIYFKWESHLLNKTIQKPKAEYLIEHLSCACTCTFHSYLFYTWKSVESIFKHCQIYYYGIK